MGLKWIVPLLWRKLTIQQRVVSYRPMLLDAQALYLGLLFFWNHVFGWFELQFFLL